MARDKIVKFMEVGDLAKWLNDWIQNYVVANPEDVSDAIRAMRPGRRSGRRPADGRQAGTLRSGRLPAAASSARDTVDRHATGGRGAEDAVTVRGRVGPAIPPLSARRSGPSRLRRTARTGRSLPWSVCAACPRSGVLNLPRLQRPENAKERRSARDAGQLVARLTAERSTSRLRNLMPIWSH